MANFPALKTGAVAQYGSDRSRRFSTRVLRFLDGSEQRFPGLGTPLLQWVIRLDLLDESELANLELFFEDEGGRAATPRPQPVPRVIPGCAIPGPAL